MAKPLLTLQTIVPQQRDFIVLNDVRYDLAEPGEFNLVDIVRMERIAKRGPLMDENATDEDVQMLRESLVYFVRAIVLEAPDEELAKLTDLQRIQLISAFTARGGSQSPGPTGNRAARRSRK